MSEIVREKDVRGPTYDRSSDSQEDLADQADRRGREREEEIDWPANVDVIRLSIQGD